MAPLDEFLPAGSITAPGLNSALSTGGDVSTDAPTPAMTNNNTDGTTPESILDGQLASVIFNGKTTFDNTDSGYILGTDTTDGLVKFYLGDSTNYLSWNGTFLNIGGDLVAGSIAITNTSAGAVGTAFFAQTNTGNTLSTVIIQNNAAAEAPLELEQFGVTSGHFVKEILFGGSSSTVLWVSDGTTPNGNLSGTAGDICLNCDSSTVYYCTGTTSWTQLGTSSGSGNNAIFADGGDGAVTFDGSTTVLGMAPSSSIYTLTRDIFLTTGTVDSGVTIKMGGYRIFATTSISNAGNIIYNGNAGSAGSSGGVPGAGNNQVGSAGGGGGGGAALPSGSVYGGLAGGGGQGGTGGFFPEQQSGSGTAGASATNSLLFSGTGAIGGAGGYGFTSGGGTSFGGGGAGGTVTQAAGVTPHWLPSFELMSNGSGFLTSTGAGGGGGGGGPGGNPNNGNSFNSGGGGGGGGAGSNGGIVCIFAKSIINTGIISANGGTGGTAGNGGLSFGGQMDNWNGGGGGGGAGGSGGIVLLVYSSLSNSGIISANGGTGGVGGTGGATGFTGNPGSNGNTGTNGTIFEIQT